MSDCGCFDWLAGAAKKNAFIVRKRLLLEMLNGGYDSADCGNRSA